MPVLDTTFLIDARRNPGALRSVSARAEAEGEALLIPAQAAIEFAAGTPDPYASLRRITESFVFRPVDEDIARMTAVLARSAMARGSFPGWPDTIIAATAVHEGMYVVTRNVRHFRDALRVRAWDYATEPSPPTLDG